MKIENFNSADVKPPKSPNNVKDIIFDVHIGKDGRKWLIPNNIPNPADFIHVEGEKNSSGYGGSTLTFKIEDGSKTINLTGPWHSNSESLFNSTGIDIRNKHLGFVVIGKTRDYSDLFTTKIEDVVYKEPWTVGEYAGYRAEKLALEFSEQYDGDIMYFYYQTRGGSGSGSRVSHDRE